MNNSKGQLKGKLAHIQIVVQIAVNVAPNLSNVFPFTNLSTQDFTKIYVSLGLFRCGGKREEGKQEEWKENLLFHPISLLFAPPMQISKWVDRALW